MKPSERFTKKTWRKPPKSKSKGYKMPNKKGYDRCALCKGKINSSKSTLLRKSYSPAKSSMRSNRPYGGTICNKCLKAQIIKETRALSSSE
jgi:ribosomal protein L34E